MYFHFVPFCFSSGPVFAGTLYLLSSLRAGPALYIVAALRGYVSILANIKHIVNIFMRGL